MLRDTYNCEHVLQKTKKCGGTCIFIRKNIKYNIMRNDLSIPNDDVEDIWLEAEVNDQKVVIGSLYRHPGTNLNVFTTDLEIHSKKSITNAVSRQFVVTLTLMGSNLTQTKALLTELLKLQLH